MEEFLKRWHEYQDWCHENYKNGYGGSATPNFEEFMLYVENEYEAQK